jgi:hypothetical protein
MLADGTFVEGRAYQRLADFVAHPNAVAAGLEEAHVVALRWYTTPAFKSLNQPLRDANREGEHPFAVTIAFINDGIKRLRAVKPAQTSTRLWCGVQNVSAPDELRSAGGTDVAPLSSTPHLKAAVSLSASRNAFLFLITIKPFMQSGVRARAALTSWLPPLSL